MVGDKASLPIIFGANFSAGFAAGTLAAAFTCPLDVARTRRQIEVISPNYVIDYHFTWQRPNSHFSPPTYISFYF